MNELIKYLIYLGFEENKSHTVVTSILVYTYNNVIINIAIFRNKYLAVYINKKDPFYIDVDSENIKEDIIKTLSEDNVINGIIRKKKIKKILENEI